MTRWCAETLEVLTALATDPGAGVRLVSGIDVARAAYPRPGWAAPLSDLGPCDPAALPAGFASGWRYTAPVVSMPVYLDYRHLLRRAGGQLTAAPLASLAQAVEQSAAPVIVNCTGAEARDFVPDPSVTAVRGQIVVAENPGLTEFFIGGPDETHELSYVFRTRTGWCWAGPRSRATGHWTPGPRPRGGSWPTARPSTRGSPPPGSWSTGSACARSGARYGWRPRRRAATVNAAGPGDWWSTTTATGAGA